ncbi:AP-1 complex subunit gamma-1 [Pyrenophora seminiperda CCB06]|uniref:AP-1 complex subunit gamma n=1 Tax=Pyrenophora seminiperda CCB06 TaxID=1302712 RepID=A0A3M7LWB6_9PLEO|nr:AP-1 complex subunit gamma-1 [Pyrenophora seminiperda CCB06]
MVLRPPRRSATCHLVVLVDVLGTDRQRVGYISGRASQAGLPQKEPGIIHAWKKQCNEFTEAGCLALIYKQTVSGGYLEGIWRGQAISRRHIMVGGSYDRRLEQITARPAFIRNVRAAKTIADERAVVQKESAAIRASFREESHDSNVRRNNVAKLLYLFTLGERTHFGQIECLKLLASPRFADKRLGYLGTMLLLDENQEVLTLYIVGLALCTLGNIASVEMARDLFPEVETIISSANPYIRRKAAICAMRICRKVPDLQEHFLEKAKLLLQDRNHGVLLCGVTLVENLCEADEAEDDENGVREIFRPVVPSLVKILKGLSSSGYAPEHDVTGITDPFLQCKLLQLLRVLARGDAQVSEQINDILAQVATNTDSSKNVGNSILYESVLTILDIEADSGLRVLGVNILGKFLSNRDNNIRYVALNTLIKVVAVEPNAVQRHRNTILDCLRDPDISIRRRALDLSFTLINESNVRVLIRELLAFLEVADNEFKPVMTSQIGVAADRFAPNKRWHVDTMLRVLKLAGNYVKEQILSSFVRLIATTPDLQGYSVQKLYAALKEDITQEGLTLAGSWVIGEYGDALLRGGQYEEEEIVKEVRESDVVDLFETILGSSYAGLIVQQYIVTASMKLTTRLSDPAQIERLRRLLQRYAANLDVEIQQRAAEYGNLFGHDQIRRGVLEKMPPPEIREESRVLGEATKKRQSKIAKKKPAQAATEDLLLDLMGDSGPSASANGAANGTQQSQDLLADIMGGASSPPQTSSPAPQSNVANIMDLFNSGPSSSPAPAQSAAPPQAGSMDLLGGLGGVSSPPPQTSAPPVASGPPAHPVYNKNDLQIAFQLKRDANAVQLLARFRNIGSFSQLSGVNLQAAVPKSQKLQLQPISTSELEGGQDATQQMRVTAVNGPPPARLKLRLKISYSSAAGPVTEQVDWAEPT